jgi:hypothetical protein
MKCPITADFNRNDRQEEKAYYFSEWLQERTEEIKYEMLSNDGYKAIDGEIIDWQTINQPLDYEAEKQAMREFNDGE